MNQETITALVIGALCSVACSSPAFSAVAGMDGGEEGAALGSQDAGGTEDVREEAHVDARPDAGGDAAEPDAPDEGGMDAGDIDATESDAETIDPCTSDSQCSADSFCRWGVCTHLCPCESGTECTPSSSGEPLCFPVCETDTDCVSTMSCVDGVCVDPRDLM